MSFGKIVAASVLLAAGSTSVRADPAVPHTFTAGTAAKASEVNDNFAFLAGRGKVYYKASTAYSQDVAGTFSATTDTVLDTLSLPKGSYLLSAKLSAHTDDAGGYYTLSCGLGVGAEDDWVGVAQDDLEHSLSDTMVVMQVPVTVTADSATAQVMCKVSGKDGTGTNPVVLEIWGLKIMAIEVASIVKQ